MKKLGTYMLRIPFTNSITMIHCHAYIHFISQILIVFFILCCLIHRISEEKKKSKIFGEYLRMSTKGKQLVRIDVIKPDMSEIKAIKGKLYERALKMFARRYGDTYDPKDVKDFLKLCQAMVDGFRANIRKFT